MAVTVTINPNALQRLLGVTGAGGRLLQRKADRVAAVARLNAASHGSIPSTIRPGPVVGKSIKVISGHKASVWVHNGTPRHPIRPRKRGGVLRFVVDGQVVFARAVNHPGYRGDPYLVNALKEVVR